MYNIAYFQNKLFDLTCPSFLIYKKLCDEKQIHQPIIFCDTYDAEAANIPIFHSYYLNQHYHKKIILTDFDQIKYIANFHNQNFLILYNQFTHEPINNTYKYITSETILETFLIENCYEYKQI